MSLPGSNSYPRDWWAVDGTPVKLKFVNSFPDDPNQLGEFDPQAYTIKIRKGLTKPQIFQVFIHELGHLAEEGGNDVPHKFIHWLEDHFAPLIIANWDQFSELFSG